MSRTNELNDNLFCLSSDLLSRLSEEFRDEMGEEPTVEEIQDLLYWGIKGNTSKLFSDFENQDIKSVLLKSKKKKFSRAKKGDLFAIPSDISGLYHILIYVGKYGSFGDAFFIVKGKKVQKPLKEKDLNFLSCHIFTGQEKILNGNWVLLDNRVDLVKRFPEKIEYFYPKHEHLEDKDIHEFGCAETPYKKDGTGSLIRQLSREESIELGLNQTDFKMVLVEEQVSEYLNKKNKD